MTRYLLDEETFKSYSPDRFPSFSFCQYLDWIFAFHLLALSYDLSLVTHHEQISFVDLLDPTDTVHQHFHSSLFS